MKHEFKRKATLFLLIFLTMALIFVLAACGEPEKGEKGDAGVGISNIAKTSSDGDIDTYTITYTDGSTTVYSVTNGAIGPDGAKGDAGNEVRDVQVAYNHNSLGEQTVTYTFYMMEGDPIVHTQIAEPTGFYINEIANPYIEVVSEDEEIPKIYLHTHVINYYSEPTYRLLELTDDMIVSGNVDFHTPGTYMLNLRGTGSSNLYYEAVHVYDPASPKIISATLEKNRSGGTPIWSDAEITSGEYNLSNMYWFVLYDNGSCSQLPVTSKQVSFNADNSSARVSFDLDGITLYQETFDVRVESNLSAINYSNAELYKLSIAYSWGADDSSSSNPYFFYNVDTKELDSPYVIRLSYTASGTTYSRYVPITADMLSGFDAAKTGRYSSSVTLTYQYTDSSGFATTFQSQNQTVVVYKDTDVNYEINFSNYDVRTSSDNNISAISYNLYQRNLYLNENGDIVGYSSQHGSYGVLTKENFVGNIPDFSTVGSKQFKCQFFGKQTEDLSIYVYDPYFSNIEYMYWDFPIPTFSLNTPVEKIRQFFITPTSTPKTIHVYYFENVYGASDTRLHLTDDMLNFEETDTSKGGITYVELCYDNYILYMPIYITNDMADATLTYTLTGTHSSDTLRTRFTKLELYNNGFAVAYNGENRFGSDPKINLNYKWNQEKNTLTLLFGNDPVAILAVSALDETAKTGTFANYDFSKLTPTQTYTFGIDSVTAATVKLYENGFMLASAGPEGDEEISIIGYRLVGNRLYVLPMHSSPYFIINADNTLAPGLFFY